jgi:hypothetical protein
MPTMRIDDLKIVQVYLDSYDSQQPIGDKYITGIKLCGTTDSEMYAEVSYETVYRPIAPPTDDSTHAPQFGKRR